MNTFRGPDGLPYLVDNQSVLIVIESLVAALDETFATVQQLVAEANEQAPLSNSMHEQVDGIYRVVHDAQLMYFLFKDDLEEFRPAETSAR